MDFSGILEKADSTTPNITIDSDGNQEITYFLVRPEADSPAGIRLRKDSELYGSYPGPWMHQTIEGAMRTIEEIKDRVLANFPRESLQRYLIPLGAEVRPVIVRETKGRSGITVACRFEYSLVTRPKVVKTIVHDGKEYSREEEGEAIPGDWTPAIDGWHTGRDYMFSIGVYERDMTIQP
jgi:hypothetical protein